VQGSPDIWSINHVGVATRDIDATAARFAAMGFQLTPFSAHHGAWKPGAPAHALGTGNRCIMFSDSFLEILAHADRAQPARRILDFLARHEGAHIICFGSRNIEAIERRLARDGVPNSGVLPLERDVETPEGPATMRVHRLRFAPETTAEGFIQVAQHHNPEVVHQPRYMRHDNGCRQLAEVTLITDDVAGMSRAYAGYLGVPPAQEGGSARFTFTNGAILRVLHYTAARRELPGSLLPPLPCIGAVAFKTDDLGGVRERLQSAALPHIAVGERLFVPAEAAGGFGIFFDGR
jgi:hypothetical protein